MEEIDGEDDVTPHTSADVKRVEEQSSSVANQEVSGSDVVDRAMGVPYDFYSDYYDMSGEKYLIVFNHHEYKKTVYFNYQKYSPRRGTFNDVTSLKETFGHLGFNVTSHNDMDYDQIIDAVSDFCKQDHSSTSCVAIAILTHGERGGQVCAADRPYALNDVIRMLQHEQRLAGKPKLFFVQACRGEKIDAGHRIHLDGDEASIVIPTHADCLVIHSSFDEYLSYRDINGSWMIQALCSVLSEKHEDLDLLQIMTLINRAVASRITYTPSNNVTDNKKQIPEVRFTLTKFLKF